MKRVAVFTSTRAEFGLLSPLINSIKESKKLDLMLFVGGSHLRQDTGLTVNEIKDTGYSITDYFDYLHDGSQEASMAKSLGEAVILISEIFTKYDFDIVCILGDRYELLAIVSNAILFKKPIIHIHGGEKSEGAIDEQVRHMITKASHIHFTVCEEYARNVRKMGEQSWRVFITGSLAVDNIARIPKYDRNEMFSSLGLDPEMETVLLTYHPVTLELNGSPLEQITNLFDAVQKFNFQIVATASNLDEGGRIINEYIENQARTYKNIRFFSSLGYINYLNLLRWCKFVLGNSSSGIIEVPYFRIPTVNVGNRQKGRLTHKSVLTTGYDTNSIIKAILKAIDPSFIKSISKMKYKFGDGNSASKMTKIIEDICIDENLLQKKLDFYE